MPATYVSIHEVAKIQSELTEFETAVHKPNGFVTVTIIARNKQGDKLLELTLFGEDKESMQIYGWSAK